MSALTDEEIATKADELMSMLTNPLWVFSRHPDDLALRSLLESIVRAGFTIVRLESGNEQKEPRT